MINVSKFKKIIVFTNKTSTEDKTKKIPYVSRRINFVLIFVFDKLFQNEIRLDWRFEIQENYRFHK